MKKIIYAKVDNVRGQKNNQVMCHGKFVATKTNTWGINPHLNQFKKGQRIKITLETVTKKEYTKKCYEGKGEKTREEFLWRMFV